MAVTGARPWLAARGAVVAMAATVVSLLASGPAAAQYLSAYKEGLEAIEAKDWERAATAMTRAIAERGEEKAKLPARLFLRPYLPHFYLGYARFEQGDCAGALAAWAESERQGAAQRLPEFDAARRGRKSCDERTRQSVAERARQEAQDSLARSTATAAALLERSRDQTARDLWTKGDPSPSERHQQGLAMLEEARELLADAAVDAGGIRRAEVFVREADQAFAALGADLDRLGEVTRLELVAKDKGVDVRVAEARAVLARTAYLAPYPRLVSKARADLEGLVAEAGRRDATSQARLEGLAARLENSIERLSELAAPPPDALEQAAKAYLAGRHQEVIAQLAGARFAERRAQAHARLLLAASRQALYLEGGELDDELLAAAAEDARACRQDDRELAPSERFFSPRFIAFFTESTAPSSAPSG